MLVEEIFVEQTPDFEVFGAEYTFESQRATIGHYEESSSDVQPTALQYRADLLFFEDLLEFQQFELLQQRVSGMRMDLLRACHPLIESRFDAVDSSRWA